MELLAGSSHRFVALSRAGWISPESSPMSRKGVRDSGAEFAFESVSKRIALQADGTKNADGDT